MAEGTTKRHSIGYYQLKISKLENDKLRLENRVLRLEQQILKLKKENRVLQDNQVPAYEDRIRALRAKSANQAL